jgi:hypothetical protein
MRTSYLKVLQVAALVVLLGLLTSVVAFSATASILVTKDGAQTPGGGWYDYYQGGAKVMFTNDFCFFYADVVSQITAPGFITTINSATLDVYTYSTSALGTFRVFTGNTPWDETSGPFPGWDTEYASTPMQGDGYQHINVTNVVQDWVNGITNNGVGINSGISASAAVVASEEISPDWDTAEPHFTINYTQTAAVPEPSALGALSAGLIGLVGFAIRRRK